MKELKKNKLKLFSLLLVIFSVIVRVYSLPFPNDDMTNYNLKWYETLAENGIGSTLATSFTNYSPPYTYLLALASLSKNFIPPLIAIKLIATFFDIIALYVIYKIVKIKYPDGHIPYLAAAIYFSAPSVIINSSYWGQADSIYTCFLLLCLYYILVNKPSFSMTAFGLAFAVKAQAIFLAPFLLIMILRNKISWKHISIPPMVYLLAMMPVVLLGRGFTETLFVYLNQASSYKVLSANAPNFYIAFSRESFPVIMPVGLALTISAILFWIYSSSRAKASITRESTVLLATISMAIVPFLLPKMHDRYFYPADVLSIVLIFFMPKLWFIPVLYQIISTGATSIFLFDAPESFLFFAALLNALTIAILLKTQKESSLLYQSRLKILFSTVYQWIFTLLIPVILLGVGISIIATPAFYRTESKLTGISANNTELSHQERVQKVEKILLYMENKIETEDLYKQSSNDGRTVLDKFEAYYLQDIKNYWQKGMEIWKFSLLALYLTSLLAWVGDTTTTLRDSTRIGGWLTISTAIALWLLKVKILLLVPPLVEGTLLPVLFPPRILSGAFIFLLVFLLFSGTSLVLASRSKKQL